MKEDKRKKSREKGSWEAARKEFEETWIRELGFGFATFDWEVDRRIPEPPGANSAVTNARTSFRTIMTFLKLRLKKSRIISTDGKTTKTHDFTPQNSADIEAGNNLLGEILFRVLSADDEDFEDYFKEIVRLRRNLDKGNQLPMKMAFFKCAWELKKLKGTDPTRAEVWDVFYNTTKHRPSDGSSLVREAKLDFLKETRGRPKKTRDSTY